MINKILSTFNFQLTKINISENKFPDFDDSFLPIMSKCLPFTMTSEERLYAFSKAIEYITNAKVEGDIVECGVWKGGSSMCAMLSLINNKDTSRMFYLYDTYEGMSEPTEMDADHSGKDAKTLLNQSIKTKDDVMWCYAPIDDVKSNIESTNYPKNLVHFVKGKVEDTIPQTIPDKIAILRLDTDWYESTYHELKHLFPRLVKGGVIIIDDYGHWKGAREAVDQYFNENGIHILLNRIDYTGRIGIKN
jgi:O-methyltransferase